MKNKLDYYIDKDKIIVSFYGELDSTCVKKYRTLLTSVLDQCSGDVIFDFKNTTFIDSAGIGLVLGRYQQLHLDKRELIITGLNKTGYKVFEISGLFSLMKYQEEVKQ